MAKRSIDRNATGLLLAGLALCALLMSGAFFLHLRRATDGHFEAAAAKARALPGVTLTDGHPGVIVTSMETDGQAARLGISVGDGVVSLNGTPNTITIGASDVQILGHGPEAAPAVVDVLEKLGVVSR